MLSEKPEPQHSALSSQHWRDWFAAVAVLLSRILTAPRSPWESDEMLFAAAVRVWDPSRYHPHPPGYPLFVLLGKVANVIAGDPWRGLLILNILAAPLGFLALVHLFRRLTGDPNVSLCGAFVFYLSAAVLVHGTLAMSDGVGVALVIAALLGFAKIEDGESPLFAAVFTSLAIGCRPQFVLAFVLPMIWALIRMRSMRQRAIAVATFIAVSLLWFVPLVVAAGGPHALLVYETNQARYFAAHDAAISRATFSAAGVALRFLVHPWGSKIVTIPLLVIVALGILPAWRRRRALVPIVLFTAVYVWFELRWMDPWDAARYDMPAMIFGALLVAFGLGTIPIRFAKPLITGVIAVLSLWYVWPILEPRHETLSAPAASAAFIKSHYPTQTVVLVDGAMRQDAEYLLADYKARPANAGLRETYDRPAIPLVRWENGSSRAPRAKVFAWPASDAYGKLTRNLYRSAVVEPVPPGERYLPLDGIYDPERDNDGNEWRWMSREASLRLPPQHTAAAAVHLLIPAGSFQESLDEELFVNGKPAARVALHRGVPATVVVPLPPGDCVVRMVASSAYVPDQVLHNGDTRLISAQLLAIVQQ